MAVVMPDNQHRMPMSLGVRGPGPGSRYPESTAKQSALRDPGPGPRTPTVIGTDHEWGGRGNLLLDLNLGEVNGCE